MPSTRISAIVIIAACTAAALHGAVETPEDLAREISAIGRVHDTWAADWNGKRIDHIMTLYTVDAVFLRPTAERTTGLTAIRSLFEKALASNTPHILFHSITIERSGNLAYDSGTYEETIVSAGAARASRGDYLIILKRQMDGRWLITQQTWTNYGTPEK